mgnify:CR=1 FL=1
MDSKEQIYRELVKEARSTNALLQGLRGHFGKEYGWAGKRLVDKLSTESINTISDKGYVKFNKNLSTVQMKATLKAIKEFKGSKTSRVKGVKENIENIKKGIGTSLEVDNKTAQAIYDFFATDKYKLNNEVKYEALKIAIEVDRINMTEDDYLNIVSTYIEYGNDADIKEELKSIYTLVQSGTLDLNRIKNLNNVGY